MTAYLSSLLSPRQRKHFLAMASRARLSRSGWLILNIFFLLMQSGCISSFIYSPRPEIGIQEKPIATKPQVIITDNTIYQNNRSGLRIRGDMPVHITNCDIYQNGRAGINLEHAAKVFIDKSYIFSNKTSGIGANNATQIFITNSRIHQNQQGGIRIRRDEGAPLEPTTVSLKHNKMFLNQQGGIHAIANSPEPIELIASENDIYRNGRTGIRIEDNVRMSAAGNNIFKNETAGIASYITADVPPMFDIYQNKIYFNRGAGIFVQSGTTGGIGISNNMVYNNYRGGIGIGLLDEPGSNLVDAEIYHNTIVANGSDLQGAGIRNDSRGDVIIKNNIIAFNYAAGIMTLGCRNNSYNLLFANGETSTTREESTNNLSFLIDKIQYAGCPGRQWGDILAPPLFVNPDIYNFALQDNSPARNAADTINAPYFQSLPGNDIGAAPFTLPAR